MFVDFARAFAELFTRTRGRVEVSGLLLTMAMLPVSELVVTRMFSHLILGGRARYQTDPTGVARDAMVFFVAFAMARGLHHIIRLNRVRVFRRGFDASQHHRAPAQEAWGWAAAFELSTALVALIQVAAFCALFTVVELGSGLANVAIVGVVLLTIASIYRRQLDRQVRYLTEGQRTGTTAIGERVGKRVRDAELGAVVASLAMAGSLAVVLYRAVGGHVAGADAIVLFIGLRMMYSQVGNLSASAMRFARVKARLTAGSGSTAVTDVDDGLDDFDDSEEESAELQPATPSAHRTQIVNHMLLAGQRGEIDEVQRAGARLRVARIPMESEKDAQVAAEAFAELASSTEGRLPLVLMWWPRPFPGSPGNWLSPLLLHRLAARPVVFQRPTAPTNAPHLLAAGSLLGSAQQHSVVMGVGARDWDAEPDPRATYLSVRGPLSAQVLQKAGGPSIESFGDPLLLTSRVFPVWRTGANGQLAFVRHAAHAGLPVKLPEGMIEVSAQVSRPQDVEGFVRTLATYAGVVTSDPSVIVVCDSYGVPHAAVAFPFADDLSFVFRDHALSIGAPDSDPFPVDPDLRRVAWDDLLVTHPVTTETLDAIGVAVRTGVETYLDRAAPD